VLGFAFQFRRKPQKYQTPRPPRYDSTAESRLNRACQELKQRGFASVQLLVGGLDSWRSVGLPLQGKDSQKFATRIITPASFYGESQYRPWIIVDSATTKGEVLPCSEQSIVIPFGGDVAGYLSKIKSALQGRLDDDQSAFGAIFLDTHTPRKRQPVAFTGADRCADSPHIYRRVRCCWSKPLPIAIIKSRCQ